MTTIAAIAMLFATFLYFCYDHNRQRARNLDVRNADLREQLAETLVVLDDAHRNLAHVQRLHASLLAENNTLLVDLMHSEEMSSYYRAHQRQRNAMLAGTLLMLGAPNPRKHLYAHKLEQVP